MFITSLWPFLPTVTISLALSDVFMITQSCVIFGNVVMLPCTRLHLLTNLCRCLCLSITVYWIPTCLPQDVASSVERWILINVISINNHIFMYSRAYLKRINNIGAHRRCPWRSGKQGTHSLNRIYIGHCVF